MVPAIVNPLCSADVEVVKSEAPVEIAYPTAHLSAVRQEANWLEVLVCVNVLVRCHWTLCVMLSVVDCLTGSS